MMDHKTEEGKELQALIKKELRGYLEYSNDVLPRYIIVMLAQGTQQALVVESLEAFLGTEKASQFAEWRPPPPPFSNTKGGTSICRSKNVRSITAIAKVVEQAVKLS
jgi:hypothetical protein